MRPMDIRFRQGEPGDAQECGAICYDAFAAISNAHNFPPDFPSVAVATEVMTWLLGHPKFYAVVAEQNGRIIGSNFLDMRNPVYGVGPITVSRTAQDKGVGRRLMQEVQSCAAKQNVTDLRLVQAAFHGRSLSLYASLGFDVKEPLVCLQGAPLKLTVRGHRVRPATAADIGACNRLCQDIHGHDRGGELNDAVKQGTATVVEREGRITGYATSIAFFGHAVGEGSSDLQGLLGAATSIGGPGFLLPARNTGLLRWCLEHGLRVVQPLTLMSVGHYKEPSGAFLPSIWY